MYTNNVDLCVYIIYSSCVVVLCFAICYISLHPTQSGNTLLHVVAGKGNYDALKVFLKSVKLPEINHQNKVISNGLV